MAAELVHNMERDVLFIIGPYNNQQYNELPNTLFGEGVVMNKIPAVLEVRPLLGLIRLIQRLIVNYVAIFPL